MWLQRRPLIPILLPSHLPNCMVSQRRIPLHPLFHRRSLTLRRWILQHSNPFTSPSIHSCCRHTCQGYRMSFPYSSHSNYSKCWPLQRLQIYCPLHLLHPWRCHQSRHLLELHSILLLRRLLPLCLKWPRISSLQLDSFHLLMDCTNVFVVLLHLLFIQLQGLTETLTNRMLMEENLKTKKKSPTKWCTKCHPWLTSKLEWSWMNRWREFWKQPSIINLDRLCHPTVFQEIPIRLVSPWRRLLLSKGHQKMNLVDQQSWSLTFLPQFGIVFWEVVTLPSNPKRMKICPWESIQGMMTTTCLCR